MPRSLFAALLLAALALPAAAKDKIDWVKDPKALQKIAGDTSADAKPVLLLVMSRQKDFEELNKAVLGNAKLIAATKKFTCVLLVDDGNNMTYQGMMMMGFGRFENKFTIFNPKKFAEAQGINPDDPRDAAKLTKLFKEATLWESKAKRTSPIVLTKTLVAVDKKYGAKKPGEKKDDPKKDDGKGEKKPHPEDAQGGNEKKVDAPAKDTEAAAAKLVARAERLEKAGKLYDAWKLYNQAAKHVSTKAGAQAAEAVARMTKDPRTKATIDGQKADADAERYLNLGKSFMKNKKYVLASSYFGRVIKEHPKSKHVDEARKLLAEAEKAQE